VVNSSNILDTIRNGDWKDSDNIGVKRDNDSKVVMSEDDELDNRYIITATHNIAYMKRPIIISRHIFLVSIF